MNAKLKLALVFAAGFASGVVATNVTRRAINRYTDRLEFKNSDIITNAWDALRDDLDDPEFEPEAEDFESIRADGKKFLEELNSKKEALTDELFRKPPSEEDAEYVNYARKYKGEEDKPMEQNVFEMAPPEDIEQIFFITEEEYEKDHLSSDEIWGKVVMNYYVPDGILTDDDDNVINEADIMSAGMIREYLDHGSGGEAFYVRNNNFNTDFKIMLINESVLGDIRE